VKSPLTPTALLIGRALVRSPVWCSTLPLPQQVAAQERDMASSLAEAARSAPMRLVGAPPARRARSTHLRTSRPDSRGSDPESSPGTAAFGNSAFFPVDSQAGARVPDRKRLGAKASFQSNHVQYHQVSSLRSKALGIAATGPIPMLRGSSRL